jgi:hypothetical protein
MRVKTGYSQILLAYRQSNTVRIDLDVVPVTIPYILKDYCRTRSILGETCRLGSKINESGPVIEIDLTGAVEQLYRRCCQLLWLGWCGIRRRGRGGHDCCKAKSDRRGYRLSTARPVQPIAFCSA